MEKGLTASYTGIWAFIESAFGSILHAAKIPFRGLFMTAFSCFCIEHIAKNNKGFKNTIHSLGSVLFVKAIASPFTPIGAYIAVCFQGIIGFWIFNTSISKNRIYLFNCISQVETALQRILGIAFTFGFIPYLVLQNHQKNELITWFQSYNVAYYTYILTLIYISLHLFAGLLFPYIISRYGSLSSDELQEIFAITSDIPMNKNTNTDKKTKRGILKWGCILSMIYLSVYTLFSERIPPFLYTLILSFISISLLLLVIYPMLNLIINRFMRKNIDKENKISYVLEEVQVLKQMFIIYLKNNRTQNIISKSIRFIRMLISLK